MYVWTKSWRDEDERELRTNLYCTVQWIFTFSTTSQWLLNWWVFHASTETRLKQSKDETKQTVFLFSHRQHGSLVGYTTSSLAYIRTWSTEGDIRSMFSGSRVITEITVVSTEKQSTVSTSGSRVIARHWHYPPYDKKKHSTLPCKNSEPRLLSRLLHLNVVRTLWETVRYTSWS